MRKRAQEPKRAVGVAELKAHLSRYLDRVKRGDDLIVTEHGQPVARLTPVPHASSPDERRARLIRKGILIPARRPLSKAFWAKPSPVKDPHNYVLEALLEERRGGR